VDEPGQRRGRHGTRTNLCPEVEASIRGRFGKEVLRETTPEPIRFREAWSWSRPITVDCRPGLTLVGLAEDGLRDALGKLDKKRGQPFPRREKDLKGGRPVGS